ncbi:FkbM family methyltransferase [Methylocystis sp. JR02]|uniref:FkbM family methyltransferase n=1 Tax=Methylocystis sp. JR02 TaxID=3046284 RepID=UPI0024B9CF70|nr:FkbM family methyltransferase [Methylocystis sp. JR02]MDJ0448891.1 FkbM family methyltransferase [Methylocystis sp. JR02]
MIVSKIKSLVQKGLGRCGYRLSPIKRRMEAPIDFLELALIQASTDRPGFSFVQIGANDGIRDDPLRRFVLKHHWRGLLVEPQRRVFESLKQNYACEPQLSFENAAISDVDGVAKLHVADSPDGSANLTVFASLKKDALQRAVHDFDAETRSIEVTCLSVRSLLRKHGIESVDVLLTDVQGYDVEIVHQFLDCGMRPQIIHFEHCHSTRAMLEKLYRRLLKEGYRFSELEFDTLCLLSQLGESVANPASAREAA